ncbi:unnamed protein product [Sphagnum troendelagicum]|uniref:Uncharacterized protein n=1 Tax=Sphagnum troendelagicum TaxID=128251 RepID=A0ABP0V0Z8_9BRYO
MLLMGIVRLRVHTDTLSQFLPVDLPLPHVVVELQLLWSTNKLHPAQDNCTCCSDDENIRTFAKALASALAPHYPVHEKSEPPT